VVARLDAAQIANGRLNEMHEVWKHPQLAARARWTQVGTPAGDVPALLPPALPSDWAPRMDAVPALGEHTDAILSELGYDARAIERLRSEHAI
jgi:itaconate CoA-transferase